MPIIFVIQNKREGEAVPPLVLEREMRKVVEVKLEEAIFSLKK